MSTSYPTGIDSYPTHSTGDVIQASYDNNEQDAIVAIQTKLGINGSAVSTTVDYKLSGIPASDYAASLTGSETFTNKTLTSPKINVGSDATGDIYYRNSGGAFTRLGIGTTGQVVTVAAGLPSWATPTAVSNASSSVAGIVQIASAAQITAGTATGSTGAVLAMSPDQLALATPVFNGSALTNLPFNMTFGQTSRVVASGTGTQTIAHGLGRVPKMIQIFAQGAGTSGAGIVYSQSMGTGTASNNTCTWSAGIGSTYHFGQNSKILDIYATDGTSLLVEAVISALDSTNITLNFTTMSGTGAFVNIQWIAFG